MSKKPLVIAACLICTAMPQKAVDFRLSRKPNRQV
jgi:hypothetical protein